MTQPTSNAIILLVDDEINILNSLQRLLRRDGYTIMTQSDPRDAMMIFAQKEVAVVISDYKMPVMTGVEFLQAADELSPATRKILLSGCSDSDDFIENMRQDQRFHFMLKPWDADELKALVREEYNRYHNPDGPAKEEANAAESPLPQQSEV